MLKNHRDLIETIMGFFTIGELTGKIQENGNGVNSKDLINTKFKDYRKLMYSGKKKYGDYWREKNVFKS